MLHIRRVKFYRSLLYFRPGWCRRLVFQIQRVNCAYQLLHDVVTLCDLQVVISQSAWEPTLAVFTQGFPRSSSLPADSSGPHQFCLGPPLHCRGPRRNTHQHTFNKWLGSPPSGQRSRCWPLHLIYRGSQICSAPLDPVQHLFSHQGMLCWRGAAMPLYRLALPSRGSGEDEVWDCQRQKRKL